MDIFNENTIKLVKTLETYAETNEIFDIHELVKTCSMNVIYGKVLKETYLRRPVIIQFFFSNFSK